MKDDALAIVPQAVMTAIVAVAGIVIGGIALDTFEPKLRGIPVLGSLATDARAVWRKVYNP